MMIIGLTGGIGSGKTTVANMFRSHGIPVYNSDQRAKELMTDSEILVAEITDLIGDKAYNEGALNRDFIASVVFNNKDLLKQLNEIVHPAVKDDFKEWASIQTSPYVIQEAAILFENGSYEHFDRMILVTAPKQTRLKRIMSRDAVTEDHIMARMEHQWEDDKKRPLSHFIIENTDLEKTAQQVEEIHKKLSELSVNKGF